MHVIPRRCKLLLKPYFLFGKKRQKQNCTHHWSTSCSLKKKKKYTQSAVRLFMRWWECISSIFQKSERTNKCLIIYLDAELKRTVSRGFVQTGVHPPVRHIRWLTFARREGPRGHLGSRLVLRSPDFDKATLLSSVLVKNPRRSSIGPTCLPGLSWGASEITRVQVFWTV